VLRSFREFMAGVPDTFQADIFLMPRDQIVLVSIFNSSNTAEGERLLKSLRAWAPPSKDTVKHQTFSELGGMPPSAKTDESPSEDFGCGKGAYLERLSDEAIDTTLDRLAKAPPGGAMGVFHYMHGAVCRVEPDATAFALRQADALSLFIGAGWKDRHASDPTLEWADETARLLRPYSGNRIYCNYQSFEGKGAAEAVFGGNHARLVAIKQKYDPTNFFRRNSNIKPA